MSERDGEIDKVNNLISQLSSKWNGQSGNDNDIFYTIEFILTNDKIQKSFHKRINESLNDLKNGKIDSMNIFDNLEYTSKKPIWEIVRSLSTILKSYENINEENKIKVSEFTLLQIYIWYLMELNMSDTTVEEAKKIFMFFLSNYDFLKSKQDYHINQQLIYPY